MKKTYINPEMEIIKISMNQQMLAGSGVESGSTLGDGFSGSDESYARESGDDWE